MSRRSGPAAAAVVALLVVLGCSAGPAVRTEEARLPGGATDPTVVLAPPGPSTLVWGACPDQHEGLSTAWECTSVPVPLDRADPAGTTVTVALTRPVLAPGDARRPLVVNPGGPGASGVELAWYLIDALPAELLDHYYPVGWDPRGVGRSRPAVDCGPVGRFELPEPEACIAGTGPLLAQMGAAEAALDLEDVRVALGVERLDYLGYSYGTALGAVYAMAHPDRVGRFVLDGAIDPTAGDPRGPLGADGVPDYAGDDLDGVIARFHELCDATAACAAGPDSAPLVEELATTVRDLPTDDFPGDPSRLDDVDLRELVIGVLYDWRTWPLAGDALRDGADGDASALAALASFLRQGYPPDASLEDRLAAAGAAHFAIYCADFGAHGVVWGCEGMPPADPLPVITAVDVAEPMLVIGTRDDPTTPGRHATELAAALGDAVAMTWEGVGHTAFPVNDCVDGAVVDQLVDGVTPPPGLVCPFLDGVVGDAALGDHLFEHQGWRVVPWLRDVLMAEGVEERTAACLAGALSGRDHRTLTHLLIGVRSDAAAAARSEAESLC